LCLRCSRDFQGFCKPCWKHFHCKDCDRFLLTIKRYCASCFISKGKRPICDICVSKYQNRESCSIHINCRRCIDPWPKYRRPKARYEQDSSFIE
jgi:hypothetical protein